MRDGPAPGQRIDVSDEAAYIVWDEQAKTEHFIRRATFAGTSGDFGFLVPTPNRPQLEVADEHLFDTLQSVTAARYEYQTIDRYVQKDFGFGCLGARPDASAVKESMPASCAGGVQVLEQKRVGDYDAAVLTFRREPGEDAAGGAAELSKWFAKHGYQSSPALAKWLEKYVQDEWCMTAFKIASGAAPAARSTHDALIAKPIRMSFKADQPFYPYREPEAEVPAGGHAPRTLRVFLAAPARFAGKLGAGEWPGRTVWSGPVDGGVQGTLFKSATMDPAPAADGWWLTEFEDRSSPRPGTDEVYFACAADQTPVARPPIIVTNVREVVVTPWWHGAVYVGVPVMLALGGLLAWRLLRRA